MYHPSSAWDEFDNPEPYREFFKDCCVICNGSIPKEWSHYKFFGNYCVKCDRQISKKLKTNIMLRGLDQYNLASMNAQNRLFQFITQGMTQEEKQEIINDKIKDEYRHQEGVEPKVSE